ncbi:MAG: RecQ family ATP-dependent DNA helicase [Bacteroidetes bacterium]|nr:MAG: RecQ family ATP-dependent DNA helicase [Bacteroidota bacterium]
MHFCPSQQCLHLASVLQTLSPVSLSASTQMPLDILRQYWGHEAFRPLQEEIINHVVSGKDTLALLPTGGGKSVCFQVPGLCFPGLTLVISPLIALMKDQVERLEKMGVAAACINSSLNQSQIDWVLQRAMDGKYKFLYIAPERIRTEMFLMRLPRMNVSLLAVDEAHCISQWGYDFRPSYFDIKRIREICPEVPVIALTASATPQVQADIQEKLELRQAGRFAGSFRRPNLRFFVLEEENVAQRILDITRSPKLKGAGIIYARTRRLTEAIAKRLQDAGIQALAYHGGMKNSERSHVQDEWLENRCRIIVATNAFGMGIDKPDVRFVIHYNLPFDPESYYQEAGRGGRDGSTALAIAFSSAPDIADLIRWSREKYPEWEQLLKVYQLLCNYYQIPNSGGGSATKPFRIPELVAATGESGMRIHAAVRILHQERIVELEEDIDDFATVYVSASPQDVITYKQQHPGKAQLIDFLLRTAGGEVYTREVRFLPEFWAAKLKIPREELLQGLSRLAEHHLIRFVPESSEPEIRFLGPRHALSKREMNWDKYDFLRKQQERRLQEMLAYIANKSVCRSLFLQQYFGEMDHQPCGVCDVCTGRTKTKVSESDFEQLKTAILSRVKAGGESYRGILTGAYEGSAAQREQVLRFLLDKGVVKADIYGNLS